MTEMRDVIFQRGGDLDPLKLNMFMAPSTPMPALHSHPEQTEFFQVVEGIFEIKVGRKNLRLGPGEHVIVPTGALHAVANSTKDPAIVYTEVTPGLRTADFFERLATFQDDGWMAQLIKFSLLVRQYRREYYYPLPMTTLFITLEQVGRLLRMDQHLHDH